MPLGGHGHLPVSPVEPAIDALEKGHRAPVAAHRLAGLGRCAALPARMLVQRVVELQARRGLRATMAIARSERPDLTTPQPGERK